MQCLVIFPLSLIFCHVFQCPQIPFWSPSVYNETILPKWRSPLLDENVLLYSKRGRFDTWIHSNVVSCVGRVEIQIEIWKGWCTAETDGRV